MPAGAGVFTGLFDDPRVVPAYISAATAIAGLLISTLIQRRTSQRAELRRQFEVDFVNPIVELLGRMHVATRQLAALDPNRPTTKQISTKIDNLREREILAYFDHIITVYESAGQLYGHLLRLTVSIFGFMHVVDTRSVHKEIEAGLADRLDAIALATSSWRQLFIAAGPNDKRDIERYRADMDRAMFDFDRAVRKYLHDICTQIALRRPKHELLR